jgi:cytoskeletal protein RodZ
MSDKLAGNLTEKGRQGGAAALLVFAVVAVFQLILANPEPTPAAAVATAAPTDAGGASTTTAPSGSSAATTTTTATAKPSATTTAKTPTATAAKPADPRAVAARWYAAQHRLDPSKVKPLQADKLPGSKVRVLLMFTKRDGRLGSDVVMLVKDGGGWKVRS